MTAHFVDCHRCKEPFIPNWGRVPWGAGFCASCLNRPESLIDACIIQIDTINKDFARYFNTKLLGGEPTGNLHDALSNLTQALHQLKEMTKQPKQLPGDSNEQNDC